MAIRINLESQESCWRAYLNYHCYGNSMGITGAEMGAIINRWGDEIPNWQKNAESADEVDYTFDDSEFEEYRAEGYKNTEEEYGEDVNINGEKARAGGDIAMTTVGTLGAAAGSLSGVVAMSAGIGNSVGKFGKLGDFFGQNMGKGSKGGWIGFILSAASCVLAFAVALLAKKNVANKEEHKAVMALQEEMVNKQGQLTEEVEHMAELEEDIVTKADEAQSVNDKAASNIKGQKTTYDGYKNSYETLKAKIQSGQALSPNEVVLYNKIVQTMNTTSANINSTVEATSDTVNGLYDEIEGFQGEYDTVASSIAEVQGFTDYAAEIDEKTQKLCNTEKNTQMVNSISAGIAGAGMIAATAILASQYAVVWPLALAIGIAGAGFTALAVMAGIWSGKASSQQAEMSAQIGEEIAVRQTTQDMQTDTLEVYDESLDAYDGTLDNIGAFELTVPDDTAAVTDAPQATTQQTPEPKKKDKE